MIKPRFLYRAWKARLRDQPLEIAIARALIQPGALAVDAGANKGAYLYWLRRFAGADGTVLAYEPQSELARYLAAVQEAFGWTNVEVRPVALSNRTGRSTLHVPGTGVSPGASLESSVLDHASGSRLDCETDTLDQQLRGRGPLGFLKVDVEGHELALFEGAAATLRRDHPPLLFECESRHLSRHTMQDVFDFLRESGYDGYFLRSGALQPVARFDPGLHQARNSARFWDEPGYCNNFLFVAGPLPEGLGRRIEG